MKDIADDLLDDLEELESSTNQIEDQVDKVKKNQQQMEKFTGESAIETAVMMLEASKLAQDAALNSQESADISLKLSKQQQMQIDEVHDAATSWRQTIRNANQEIKGTKNFLVGMLVTSILTGAVVAGTMSWFVINTQQEQALFKNDLLDMLQTENALNQRHVNMKIDELASVIEITLGSENALDNTSTWPGDARVNHEQLIEGEINQDPISEVGQVTTLAQPSHSTTIEVDYDKIQASIAQTLSNHKTELATLIKQYQSQLSNQTAQKLASAKLDQPTAAIQPKVEVDLTALTPKLTSIEELLRSQHRQLNAMQALIKKSAATEAAPSKPEPKLDAQLNELKAQLEKLQARQTEISSGLKTLTEEFREAQKELKTPEPYQYRNPYEYKN